MWGGLGCQGPEAIRLSPARLRVGPNFGDGDCGAHAHARTHTHARNMGSDARGASLQNFRACACVYFARPTITTAKIRDYSQCNPR